jgi:thioredoxin-related protein
MKKQAFLILILLLSCCKINAQDANKIKWYTANEAFELQKKEPKKILMDVYTDWCGWCKRMDASTFTNPKVVDYLNKYYYCVKFNAEGKENVTFNEMNFINDGQYGKSHSFAVAVLQGKMSYPSIAYFDEKAQLITAVAGYLTPEQILPILAYFGEDNYKTKDFQTFSTEYSKKKVTQVVDK